MVITLVEWFARIDSQDSRESGDWIGNSSDSCESAWRAIKIGFQSRMIRANRFARIARATKVITDKSLARHWKRQWNRPPTKDNPSSTTCKWTRPFSGTGCRRAPKALSSAQAAPLCSAGIERARNCLQALHFLRCRHSAHGLLFRAQPC